MKEDWSSQVMHNIGYYKRWS